MTRISFRFLVALAAVGSLVALLGSPALAGEHKYTGVKDCGKCHKKELMGDQLAEWKKARHSGAFETLKGEEALKIAKDKGITTPPHETDECVKCHATAHGVTPEMTGKKPLKLSDGVQCESCHGPGFDYRKKKIMSDREKSIREPDLGSGQGLRLRRGEEDDRASHPRRRQGQLHRAREGSA
jgi:hypothetical protein